MNSIYAIITHHDRPLDAAEAWRECQVCAIGYDEDHRESELFDQIEQGDLVLAYSCDNRIAYVGQIKNGKRHDTTENIVGDDKSEYGFDYPSQYEVTWFDRPHHFSRKDLPPWLRDQLGKRGKTVVQIDLKKRSFDEVKRIILASPKWMPKGT